MMLNVTREELGIFAASKGDSIRISKNPKFVSPSKNTDCSKKLCYMHMSTGLFNGALQVKQGDDGKWVDCRTVGPAGLPVRSDGRYEIFNEGARYILVVESDGIFNRLSEDKVKKKFPIK